MDSHCTSIAPYNQHDEFWLPCRLGR
jgi:hypothetical protein